MKRRSRSQIKARDYVLAAAQLGGENAMPYVVSLVSSSDAFSRANGIMALPLTGSRRAVPVLIDLLQSPDMDLARLASIGLNRYQSSLKHEINGSAQLKQVEPDPCPGSAAGQSERGQHGESQSGAKP